jgi:hypothetical protein
MRLHAERSSANEQVRELCAVSLDAAKLTAMELDAANATLGAVSPTVWEDPPLALLTEFGKRFAIQRCDSQGARHHPG